MLKIVINRGKKRHFFQDEVKKVKKSNECIDHLVCSYCMGSCSNKGLKWEDLEKVFIFKKEQMILWSLDSLEGWQSCFYSWYCLVFFVATFILNVFIHFNLCSVWIWIIVTLFLLVLDFISAILKNVIFSHDL